MPRNKHTPVPWSEAAPTLVARERTAMAAVATRMAWRDDLTWREGRRATGWAGQAPTWGGDRPQPTGVDALLAGRRLELTVIYPEAFPAVPPSLYPTSPQVPWARRTLQRWHVLGDGGLCLTQAAHDWNPAVDTAADLVRKAAGWFIEYLLVEAGAIEAMTIKGVAADTALDDILAQGVPA
jgi:hypothetical protein